jgi:asparagine synthase (glutamine-hydrolysing)
MFEGISKLQPGHILVVEDGRVRTECYWDVPLDGETLAPEAAERALRERLDECVQAHLVSDVPLGVFLSGGLDSRAVTGLVSRAVQEPVRTFAVGYRDGGRDDERAYARLAATRFGTAHHELALDSSAFWGFVPWMVWSLDEPVADAPCIPLYLLSRLARRHVTVALSGEGADEILAGYGIYRRMLALQRWRRLPGLLLLRRALGDERLRRTLARAALPLEQVYRGVSDVFAPERVAEMLAPDLRSLRAASPTLEYFERTRRLEPLRRMLYLDLKVWLPDDLLVKADKMTMAASIELRVPFLDHTLVEWAWRLPSNLKLRGGVGKYVLRRAVGDLVPPEILGRAKQGFTIPIKGWLRDELSGSARRLLLEQGSHRDLLDLRAVERLLTCHESGRADLSTELFTLVVFAVWHQLFIEAPVLEPPQVPADA